MSKDSKDKDTEITVMGNFTSKEVCLVMKAGFNVMDVELSHEQAKQLHAKLGGLLNSFQWGA